MAATEAQRRAQKKYRHNNVIQRMIDTVRRRAKLKGWVCTLTKEDIVIPTHCPVLGIPLAKDNTSQQDNSPSIDRIDHRGGYTPDNIQIVSWRCNNLKKDGTLEEFEAIIQYIKDHS